MDPSSKKSLPLLLLKVLEKYTDENHFLTQEEIIDHIYNDYGILFERKAIGYSLSLLEELDYDILRLSGKGVALISRDLSKVEAQFIIDALFSSKSINGKQAKEIASKTLSHLSKYERNAYNYLNKSDEINRTSSNQVFLNIEIISEAIQNKKQVSFQYQTYNKNGEECFKYGHNFRYKVTPYFLVNNFGKYYLLCANSKYNNFASYRLEYITNIEILEGEEYKYRDIKSIEGVDQSFSLTKYLNEHIYLFSTNVIDVTIEVFKGPTLAYVYDWFGKQARLINEDDRLIVKIKTDEEAFFFWAMQYSSLIEVISPESMRKKLYDAGNELINKYKEK